MTEDPESLAVMEGLAGIVRCPGCGRETTGWHAALSGRSITVSREAVALLGTVPFAACTTPASICPVVYFRPDGSWLRIRELDSDRYRWLTTKDYFPNA